MECKCGFKNTAGMKFCGSCGSLLPDGATDTSSDAKRLVNGRRLRLATVAVVVVVVVVVTGLWYLRRLPGRDEISAPTRLANALNPFEKKNRYVGQWVTVKSPSSHAALTIRAEGEAFVLEQGQEKFLATMTNGVLRVSGVPAIRQDLEFLYAPSTDHLIATGGVEFRRMVPSDAMRDMMNDIRVIAAAWEPRATDMNTYAINETGSAGLTPDTLSKALSPIYIHNMPRNDAWGNPFQFSVLQGGQVYSIRSFGENGREDETPPGATVSPKDDIVYSNGAFVSYPKGISILKPFDAGPQGR